jgi:hypothetical protein
MQSQNLLLAFALKGAIITGIASLREMAKKKRGAHSATEGVIGAEQVTEGVEGTSPRSR